MKRSGPLSRLCERYRLRIMAPGARFRFMVVLTLRNGEERTGFGDTPYLAEGMALGPELFAGIIVPAVDPGRHILMDRIGARFDELRETYGAAFAG